MGENNEKIILEKENDEPSQEHAYIRENNQEIREKDENQQKREQFQSLSNKENNLNLKNMNYILLQIFLYNY